MSRPPRPPFRTPTAGDGSAFASPHRRFMPIEFTEMVEMQRALAELESRLGTTRNDPAALAVAGSTGDFATTLMELSALVAHTLGLHQNLYAREAYLDTAETGRSLVLHARRLAYEPDQGLSATGFAVLTIGEGLTGTLPARFALASSAKGELKAQTFETLDEYRVDAARNDARPVARTRAAEIQFTGSPARTSFRIDGTGLDLAEGSPAVLIRDSDSTWVPVSIVEADEEPAADLEPARTRVVVERLAGAFGNTAQPLADNQGAPLFRLLARPKDVLRRFAWDADPVQFPPGHVEDDGPYPGPGNTPQYGYEVTREDGGGHVYEDIYLSAALPAAIAPPLVLAYYYGPAAVLRVSEQREASVAFRRGTSETIQVGTITNGQPDVMNQVIEIETQVSGTVTYLRLTDRNDVEAIRDGIAIQAPIYASWQLDLPLVTTEPNPDPIPAPLEVNADFGDFRPGDPAVFETLDGAFSQVVEVQRLTATANGTTGLWWADVSGPPPGGWHLNDIRVRGNVVRIAHGETQSEVLGGSDGITMFQRFELKKAPVTELPGATGGDPSIEVRVDEVEWTRVDDFFDSGPHDRHYRVEFDEAQHASVVFGNGLKGAIPPSGRKNIRVVYRQGLGAAANVDRGAIARIKKAHPLVDAAVNAQPAIGGADPADPADLKRQATRFIRTFDRAVSMQDHADLALLFPGVARASARPGSGGIQVIVATADGGVPPIDDVHAFLDARRDATQPLAVVGAVAVDFFLDVEVEHDGALLTENVKRAVQDALFGGDRQAPGLFTFAARELGQAAHLSEVYERIAGVDGVTFVDVTRFRVTDVAGVADVLQIDARQWLRLPPANLAMSIAPESGS
jgi:hypothetical protein